MKLLLSVAAAILSTIAVVALIAIGSFIAMRIVFPSYVFGFIREYFSVNLGLSHETAIVLAVATASIAALAIPSMVRATLLQRRFYVPVLATVAIATSGYALYMLTGETAFFNQETGASQRFAEQLPNGGVALHSRAGYSSATGKPHVAISAVNADTIRTASAGYPPSPISLSFDKIEFFHGPFGQAKVWYAKPNGDTYLLFNRPGVDPVSGSELQPVKPDDISLIRVQFSKVGRLYSEGSSEHAAESSRSKYINKHNPTSSPSGSVGMVNIGDKEMAKAMKKSLQAKFPDLREELLTDAFVNDGLAKRTLDGDPSPLAELNLPESVRAVAVMDFRSSTSTAYDAAGLIRVSYSAQILLLDRSGNKLAETVIAAEGADFSLPFAKQDALNTLTQRIATDSALKTHLNSRKK